MSPNDITIAGHAVLPLVIQEKFQSLFSHLQKEPGEAITDDHLRSLMFGDYLYEDGEEKLYDEVTDLVQLKEVPTKETQ